MDFHQKRKEALRTLDRLGQSHKAARLAHAAVEAVVLVQEMSHILHYRQGLGLGVDLGTSVVGHGLLLHGGQVIHLRGSRGGGLAGFLYFLVG